MKKMTILILGIAMTAALVYAGAGSQRSAASSSQGAAGPTEFSAVFTKGTYNDDVEKMRLMDDLQQRANVKITWITIPETSWPERKNILVNSGDMPDVFYKGGFSAAERDQYGRQGVFLDLTDAIKQYAPQYSKILAEDPIFKATVTNPSDGKMYSIGENENRLANQLVGSWWIYQPWLDKLNLKFPTTYLEFEEVLRAFKTKDPNGNGRADEYPFVFANGWSGNSSLQNFFAIFGYGYQGTRANSNSFVVVDNKAIFVPGTENFKEAVVWLHKLFAEGLLAEEDYAAMDRNLFNAKNYSETVVTGAYAAFTNNSGYVPAERVKDFTRVSVPFKGPHGDQIWMQNSQVFGTADRTYITNKARDKVPGIMRWIDVHFDQVTSFEIAMGPVGINIQKSGNMYTYIPTPEGQNYNQFRYGQSPVAAPHYIPAGAWGTTLEIMEEDKDRIPWVQGQLKPYLTQFFVYSYPIAEETRFLQGQGREIENYIQNNLAKWLMQGGIEREWDAFQTQLRNMGIDQYTRVMQAQIDRFNQFTR